MRKCVATGQSLPCEGLIRCVVGPDNQLVADLGEELPGRGLWLTATADALHKALAQNAFSRSARCKVTIPEGFERTLVDLLARRCLQLLGFARKAGEAVSGQAKVEARVRAGKAGVLIAAADGAAEGKAKLERLALVTKPGTAIVTCLSAEELGLAFGREHVIHAAIVPGRLAERFAREACRLAGFRGSPQISGSR